MKSLDELQSCDREQLIRKWRRTFKSSPPRHASTPFLLKVLGYQLQTKELGDLPKRVQRSLNTALQRMDRSRSTSAGTSKGIPNAFYIVGNDRRIGSETGNPADGLDCSLKRPPIVLSPGVVLVREWNGQTWHVEVLEDGFTCKGRSYRSLSAVAKKITGAHWSGPRFFGVSQ